VTPCTEAPTLRFRDPSLESDVGELSESEGYTSRGHIRHFLPDREVNIAKLNQALADVFGEPALRGTELSLRVDEEYWRQVCADPWSGNIYKYNFRSPQLERQEVETLKDTIEELRKELDQLKRNI
jgi:hypothetical protein